MHYALLCMLFRKLNSCKGNVKQRSTVNKIKIKIYSMPSFVKNVAKFLKFLEWIFVYLPRAGE
jgi:hypothetical protein